MLGGSGISSRWSRDLQATQRQEVERHFPYVRPLQLDWEERPTGFRARRTDGERFEVICAGCGDIDGPEEYQPASARTLRGPYESRKLAEKVARNHERSIRLSVGRSPGGTREAMKFFFPIRRPGRPID